MKKNYFYGLLAIMMVALLGISFVSCNDDDDDNGPKSKTLVGTWKHTQEIGYVLLVFKSNGTGYAYEYYYEDGDAETYNFTYTFDKSSMILRVKAEDGEESALRVSFISSTEITFGGVLYTKQGDTSKLGSKTLVGTWKTDFGDGDYMKVVFKSNGTGRYYEYEDGDMESINFTYTYDESSQNLKMKIEYDDEEYTYTYRVTFISPTEAYARGVVWVKQ